MFLQTTGVLQEPVATLAVVVCVAAVCGQLVVVFKVGATFATVVMSGTLCVVLFESPPRIKVPITIITVVVIGGIQKVLAVRGRVLEIAVARIARGHHDQSARLDVLIAREQSQPYMEWYQGSYTRFLRPRDHASTSQKHHAIIVQSRPYVSRVGNK